MAAVQLELWTSLPVTGDPVTGTPAVSPPAPAAESASAKGSAGRVKPAQRKPQQKPQQKPRRQRAESRFSHGDIWAELTGQANGLSQATSPQVAENSVDSSENGSIKNDVPGDKTTALERLRRQVSAMETGGKQELGGRLSCGVKELDQLLPGSGLAPGTLVEWVEQDAASGAGWLAMLAAKAILEAQANKHGRLVVIDTDATFYPLAAISAGLPLDRLLIVQPANLADGLWAADQALRNPAVSVVWGVLPVLDDRQARRLQLAAEIGQTMGLWLRPAKALSEPSWADVRWFVRSLQQQALQPEHSSAFSVSSTSRYDSASRYLETRLVRCRGGRPGTSVTLQIDSSGRVHHVSSKRQATAVPLVAQLADPATAAATATARTESAKRRPA